MRTVLGYPGNLHESMQRILRLNKLLEIAEDAKDRIDDNDGIVK